MGIIVLPETKLRPNEIGLLDMKEVVRLSEREEIQVGGTVTILALTIKETCLNFPYEYSEQASGVHWSSGNANIATVNGGTVTGVAAGNTYIGANWTAQRYMMQPPCNPGELRFSTGCGLGLSEKNSAEVDNALNENEESRLMAPGCGQCYYAGYAYPYQSATVTVKPGVQKIQYNVNGNWLDVPSGGLGPICLGTAITFKAIPTSGTFSQGSPTWAGDASGTGEQISVTFNNSGSRTITATSGNTVSHTINVRGGNNPANIAWNPPNPTITSGSDDPTTSGAPFVFNYGACADISNNTWNLRVNSVTGGTTMVIPTGQGYRNPTTNPPIDRAEAIDAINEMNSYYPEGIAQRWHTLEASKAHEFYHHSEWECSGNHYWEPTETVLEQLTVPYSSYNNESDAISAIRTTTNGADTKADNFDTVVDNYFGTLDDGAFSRPYAAGQIALNSAIADIRQQAAANGWKVPDILYSNPNTATPCHKPWLPYTP